MITTIVYINSLPEIANVVGKCKVLNTHVSSATDGYEGSTSGQSSAIQNHVFRGSAILIGLNSKEVARRTTPGTSNKKAARKEIGTLPQMDDNIVFRKGNIEKRVLNSLPGGVDGTIIAITSRRGGYIIVSLCVDAHCQALDTEHDAEKYLVFHGVLFRNRLDPLLTAT